MSTIWVSLWNGATVSFLSRRGSPWAHWNNIKNGKVASRKRKRYLPSLPWFPPHLHPQTFQGSLSYWRIIEEALEYKQKMIAEAPRKPFRKNYLTFSDYKINSRAGGFSHFKCKLINTYMMNTIKMGLKKEKLNCRPWAPTSNSGPSSLRNKFMMSVVPYTVEPHRLFPEPWCLPQCPALCSQGR